MWPQHLTALVAYLDTSTQCLVVELDGQGRVVDCNAGLVQLLGCASKPVGQGLTDLFEIEGGLASGACPGPGNLVARTRPPLRPMRFDAQVLSSQGACLLVGERLQGEQDVVLQLARLNDEQLDLVRELHREKAALQRSLDRVKRLEGLISICMHCHRIRDEQQTWQRLEQYIVDHSDANFSHGICPSCLAQKYGPDTDDEDHG